MLLHVRSGISETFLHLQAHSPFLRFVVILAKDIPALLASEECLKGTGNVGGVNEKAGGACYYICQLRWQHNAGHDDTKRCTTIFCQHSRRCCQHYYSSCCCLYRCFGFRRRQMHVSSTMT